MQKRNRKREVCILVGNIFQYNVGSGGVGNFPGFQHQGLYPLLYSPNKAVFPATHKLPLLFDTPEGAWRLSWQPSEFHWGPKRGGSNGPGVWPVFPPCGFHFFCSGPYHFLPPCRFQLIFWTFVIFAQLPGLGGLSPAPS